MGREVVTCLGSVNKPGTVVQVVLYPTLNPETCFKVSVRVFLSLHVLIPLKGQPWSNCIANVWLHAPVSLFDFLVAVNTYTCSRPRLGTPQVLFRLFNSTRTQTSSFPF